MKIGFSLGRCVRDVVKGLVKIEDIAWIIASTYIETKEQLHNVIAQYAYEPTYLGGLDIDECQRIALQLYDSGRVLQPRMMGIRRTMVPEGAIWADLFPTIASEKTAVKTAWNGYRTMLQLTEQLSDDAELHWR
jgi:hypothetical protein